MAQVVDAKKASYGVENATYAVVQLAQTTMRSELGKITLDKTFEERATLNLNIVESIRYSNVLHMIVHDGRHHTADTLLTQRGATAVSDSSHTKHSRL